MLAARMLPGLCVNPVTWKRDSNIAKTGLRRGAVLCGSRRFMRSMAFRTDSPGAIRELARPKAGLLTARCDGNGAPVVPVRKDLHDPLGREN